MAKDKTTKTDNYAVLGAGITTLSSLAGAFAETEAFKSQLDNKTNADIMSSNSTVASYLEYRNRAKEDIASINRVLGDRLSERTLTAIKEASLMRASGAMTGTTGGTTDIAIKEAYFTEMMDRTKIINRGKQQMQGLFNDMQSKENTARNRIDSLLVGGGVKVETDPFLKAMQGGLSSIASVMDIMPQLEKIRMFGVENGNKAKTSPTE